MHIKSREMILALLVLCLLGGLLAAIFLPAISANLKTQRIPVTSSSAGRTPGQTAVPGSSNVPGSATTPLASGVTMLAQDTFQRPDQALWGTSSGLRPWAGDANTSQAFAIVKHAGQITGGQGALQAILDVTSANADVVASGTVSQFDDLGAVNLGIVIRWQDAQNWYKALIDGKTLQLLRDVNGQISVLSTHTFKAQSGVSYSLHLRALGSTLFARAWPSNQAEPTTWSVMGIDTQLTTGKSGIRVKIAPGVVIRISSFQETSVVGPM